MVWCRVYFSLVCLPRKWLPTPDVPTPDVPTPDVPALLSVLSDSSAERGHQILIFCVRFFLFAL